MGCENSACTVTVADNNLCVDVESAAVDVGAGWSVYGSYDDLTDDVDFDAPNCVGEDTDGPDAFYYVNVPAGEVLRARAESYGDEPPLVYGITSCADPANTCVAGGSEIGSSNVAEFTWLNDTGATTPVLVVVDNEFSSADELFGLTLEVKPQECTPGAIACSNGVVSTCNADGLNELYQCDGACNSAGDGCDTPRGGICADSVLLSGATGSVTGSFFRGESSFALAPGRTGACFLDDLDDGAGPDTFYRIELTAGDLLELNLQTNYSDAHLNLLQDCQDASTCLENNPPLGAAQLEYYATQTETVFIVIDGEDYSAADFTLNWNIQTGLNCEPNGFRCIDASTLGVCSPDGLTESQVTCTCADGACEPTVADQDVCATAASLPPIMGGYAAYLNYDDLANDVDEDDVSCVAGEDVDGGDAFFAVTVPAGQILQAEGQSYGATRSRWWPSSPTAPTSRAPAWRARPGAARTTTPRRATSTTRAWTRRSR